MLHGDNIDRRLLTRITKQKAAVVNIPTSEHHGRIIASHFQFRRDDSYQDYTWLDVSMAFPQNEHLSKIPFRDGGKLLYDETKALALGGTTQWFHREIETTSIRYPTFFYGKKVTNFDTGEVSDDDPVDFLGIEGIRARRREVLGGILHEYHGVRFDDYVRAHSVTNATADHRWVAWVQLLENWVYAAACMSNSLTGTVDTLIRGVTEWRFEDFYDNINTGDLVTERLNGSATSITGSNFFYLERESNSSSIRLRYTPSVRKAPQYCKEWMRNVLYREVTHMHGRDLDPTIATSNW